MFLVALLAVASLQSLPADPTSGQAGARPAGQDDGDGGDRPDAGDDDDRHAPETTVTVTARRLDAARARIGPSLGAAVYTISNEAIEDRPGGETRTLGSLLIQAPGVTRDGRGSLVIRGARGGIQYRLNGIILPAGPTISANRSAPVSRPVRRCSPARYRRNMALHPVASSTSRPKTRII